MIKRPARRKAWINYRFFDNGDPHLHTHLYLYRRVCVCLCVSFQAYTRRRLCSDRNQIWHTHADAPRKGSGQDKNVPHVT